MSVNDNIFNGLYNSEGSTINEKVYHYLGSLGYTGTLSDRLSKLEEGGKKGWQALLHESPTLGLIGELFSQGEQGAMYLPRPTYLGQQTLYQESTGVTPVTADGDPSGLVLDQSGNGRGVVNLLTQTGDLTSADWTAYGDNVTTVTPNISDPDGGTGAFEVDFGAGDNRFGQQIGVTGLGVTAQLYMRADSNTQIEILLVDSVGDLTIDVVSVTTEWQKFEVSSPYSSFFEIATEGNGSLLNTRPAATIEVWHPQVELGSTATAYQPNGATVGGPGYHATQEVSADRPLYKTDGTLHWLDIDSVDDSLESDVNLANFSGGFRLSVAFSSEKVAAAYAISQYNPGTTEGLIVWIVQGALRVSVAGGTFQTLYTAPYTTGDIVIVSLTYDGASLLVRVNGAEVYNDAASISFVADTFTIGNRRSGDRPLGGSIYGLVASEGIGDVSQQEQYLATLAGVTL